MAGLFYSTVADHPGNVVGLIGSQQELANEYRYSPWGESDHAREDIPNALQFQARHYDPATGLYAWRARWYSPELARFISEDPIGLEGGINPYVFAENNPVNFTDPYGLQTDPCPTGPVALLPVICELPGLTSGGGLKPYNFTPGGAGRGPSFYTPTPGGGGTRRRQPSGPGVTQRVEEFLISPCGQAATSATVSLAFDALGIGVLRGAKLLRTGFSNVDFAAGAGLQASFGLGPRNPYFTQSLRYNGALLVQGLGQTARGSVSLAVGAGNGVYGLMTVSDRMDVAKALPYIGTAAAVLDAAYTCAM